MISFLVECDGKYKARINFIKQTNKRLTPGVNLVA